MATDEPVNSFGARPSTVTNYSDCFGLVQWQYSILVLQQNCGGLVDSPNDAKSTWAATAEHQIILLDKDERTPYD